jgi:hypothetical protein
MLLVEDLPKFFALGGDFFDCALHLGEQVLNFSDIAGENSPPAAQHILLIEKREGGSRGSSQESGTAPAAE